MVTVDSPPLAYQTVSAPFVHENPANLAETWRFFVPIFLHVGIVHFLLNMVAQVFAGAQVEKEMGESGQPEQ